jgi:uncharacterized membrane protein
MPKYYQVRIDKERLLKSVVYRFYSSGIIFTITFVFTGRADISLKVSAIELFTKIFTYYLFEKLWDKKNSFRKFKW